MTTRIRKDVPARDSLQAVCGPSPFQRLSPIEGAPMSIAKLVRGTRVWSAQKPSRPSLKCCICRTLAEKGAQTNLEVAGPPSGSNEWDPPLVSTEGKHPADMQEIGLAQGSAGREKGVCNTVLSRGFSRIPTSQDNTPIVVERRPRRSRLARLVGVPRIRLVMETSQGNLHSYLETGGGRVSSC
ncbi:hypothetical protein F66182_8172 [Fusarium sp. NRRL 66182]|nr:hypothetical protein F66182_8172 [Fusarium sp. NRRL 66182]